MQPPARPTGRYWAVAALVLVSCVLGAGMLRVEEFCVRQDAPLLLMRQGAESFDQGRFQNSIDAYNEVIKLQPNDAHAYCKRGDAFARLGQLKKALADETTAIKLDGKLGEAYFNRGEDLVRTRQYDAALEDFDKVLELNPVDSIGHYDRALCYRSLGKHDLAEREFELAVQDRER